MLVGLNLPQLNERETPICQVINDRLESFYLEEKGKLNTEGSAFSGLFVEFDRNVDEATLEPVVDDHRFHCENFLNVLEFERNKNLSKNPRRLRWKNNYIQYVLEGAEDIARQIGGDEMNIVYNSLLVSEAGGKEQVWHYDVHDNHAPDFPVIAMIISVKEGTTVDAKIFSRVRKIEIPVGYALVFDAKNFLHRGVAYSDLNTRIYLKFASREMVGTRSGEAEVAPLPVCSACGKQIKIEMDRHVKFCIPSVMKKYGFMDEARAQRLIKGQIDSERKKSKRYYNRACKGKKKRSDKK